MISRSRLSTDDALRICKAINERAFFAMGVTEKVSPLPKVDLKTMIQAVELVKRKNKASARRAIGTGKGYTSHVTPADRLIAAAYALEHYEPDDEAVVVVPGHNMFGEPARKALGIVELAGAAPDEGCGHD